MNKLLKKLIFARFCTNASEYVHPNDVEFLHCCQKTTLLSEIIIQLANLERELRVIFVLISVCRYANNFK